MDPYWARAPEKAHPFAHQPDTGLLPAHGFWHSPQFGQQAPTDGWRSEPHTRRLSCLRHLGPAGPSGRLVLRGLSTLVHPKLTEEPSCCIFLSPQCQLRVLGHRPSAFPVRCWGWKGKAQGGWKLFSSCPHGLKHQLRLCLI